MPSYVRSSWRGGEIGFEGTFEEGWLVRRPRVAQPFQIVNRPRGDEAAPVALVIKLGWHFPDGGLLSATPRHVRLHRADRLLVLMPGLVIAVKGADPFYAFGHLADVLVGTHEVLMRPRKRVPAQDLKALAWL